MYFIFCYFIKIMHISPFVYKIIRLVFLSRKNVDCPYSHSWSCSCFTTMNAGGYLVGFFFHLLILVCNDEQLFPICLNQFWILHYNYHFKKGVFKIPTSVVKVNYLYVNSHMLFSSRISLSTSLSFIHWSLRGCILSLDYWEA